MNEQSDEELTARLMRIAGERAEIPEDVESRVYGRVLDEWTAASNDSSKSGVYRSVRKTWRWQTLRSGFLKWVMPAALAASAAFFALYVSNPEPVMQPAIGQVAKVSNAAADDPIVAGQQLYPGMTLSTNAGQGISILLARNESLRLGEKSRITVDSRDHFTLLEGKVYADTGQFMYRNGGLSIRAGSTTITDIGTQFAVLIDGQKLDVGVREGRVDVHRGANTNVAIAGERLLLDTDGAVATEALAPDSAYWEWASELAPRFDIESKSLSDFLNWASRETGMQITYASEELRMAAMRTDLHGSVADFTPAEAIAVVMTTTNFNYRIESGTVYIDR